MASSPSPPALLSASPSSVHFSGFQLDQTYSQRVCVRNDSGKSLRLQFSFPGRSGGAAAFRAAFAGDGAARKPFVSAGLTEELVVTFRAPLGFQYYYDCIRVRCEQVAYASNAPVALAGELLIPLHAYPVANTVRDFPTRLDFGVVPLGQVARREIPLGCSVPIEFEFAVELLKAHPSFTVFPLTGVIPANGAARVEIEFRPLSYCTASAELKLLVSQLGFEPVVCTLVGSSTSIAGQASATSGSALDGGGGNASPGQTGRRSDGAGADPAASPSKSLSPKRQAGGDSRSSRKATGVKDRAGDESKAMEMVDGVEIPPNLDSVSGVTFVLNQQAGKLRPRDLKKAIAASRQLRQQQEQGLDTGDNNSVSDNQVGTLTFSALIRHEIANSSNNDPEESDSEAQVSIGRMRFQREVKEVEALEKALEFQSHQQSRLGAPLLSKEQSAALEEMRSMNSLARARDVRDKMRSTFDTATYGLDSQKPAPSSVKTATLPVELATGAALAAVAPPDFKAHKNDLWARRARVLQRLVRAVSTVMVRFRAQQRLGKIKRWLGQKPTRADVRKRVALEWKRMRRGDNQLEHDGDGGGSRSSSTDRRLYLSGVPEVERREFRSRQRAPVAMTDVGLELKRYAPPGFATFLPLRERDEALVMGHAPLTLPPLPTYVPLFDVEDAESAAGRQQRRANGLRPARTLRAGAFDEYASALRSLSMVPVTADASTTVASSSATNTSLLELLPLDVFLRPQAAVRPLVIMDRDPTVSLLNMRVRESDAGFVLRPTRGIKEPSARTFSERRALQIGMASVAAERRWRRQPGSHDGSDDKSEATAPSLFPSDVWLPTTTAKSMGTAVDPLFWFGDPQPSGNDRSFFRDVWDVGVGRTDCGIPAFATAAEDVPALSDSESDVDSGDEDDTEATRAAGAAVNARRRRIPTWEDALRLFELDNTEHQDGGHSTAVFERYAHLEQQERDYCAARRELLERLPKRLEPLAQQLAQIPGAPDLVVEGHGPQRPLHEPSRVGVARVSVK